MLENVNSFNDPSKLTNSFVNVCKCLYANRKFYLACFQYIGQNSLYEYLNEFYYELWRINIDVRYTGSGFKLTETELHLMAKMKAHSLVGIISDWVKDGMHDNYMSYFEQVHAVLEFEASGYARLSDQMMLEKQEGQAGKKNEEGKSYLRVC